MFGISTSWRARLHKNASTMIAEIRTLGIDCIELNFALSEDMVNDICVLARERSVRVLSTHNFCPVPEGVDIKKTSPDHYSLASLDDKERKMAVDNTKRTIEAATRLKAMAVVIHAGRVEINDGTRRLADLISRGLDASQFIHKMRSDRERELKNGYLDSLLNSIEELSIASKNSGVKLALENRFYHREIPSLREFEIIFSQFGKDSNIYYWHDSGHAQVFENLGLESHADYLNRFADRLAGMHIHDVVGIMDDHNVPLKGSIDFRIFKPYLGKNIIKILEVHGQAGKDEVKKAINYLIGLYGN